MLLDFTISARQHRLIQDIQINNQQITYFLNKNFHAKYLRENLYVEYPNDIDLSNLDYTILTMPLIMNTIGIVWISNKEYTIPAMDEELYYSLKIVKEVIKRFYPYTRFDGELIPAKLVDNSILWNTKKASEGIALPFSHGLDSLCTSMRHRTTPQLLITARGMPDTPCDMWQENWEYTQQAIAKYGHIHGHSSTYITSNFHEFFNWKELCTFSPEIQHWRLCMVEGLGWMGLAAPILVTKGYRTFMLPANGDWESPHPGADCPLINDVVRFAGITNISDGFEITRAQKNSIIANICNTHHLEKPYFIICENLLPHRENCCACYKCITSILALLLIDEDPNDYGFPVCLPDFINHFKNNFIEKAELEPDTARWFKYYQEEAQKKMDLFDPQLKEFFNWYVTLNFDTAVVEWNNIVIDYRTFTDLYPHIPKEILAKGSL